MERGGHVCWMILSKRLIKSFGLAESSQQLSTVRNETFNIMTPLCRPKVVSCERFFIPPMPVYWSQVRRQSQRKKQYHISKSQEGGTTALSLFKTPFNFGRMATRRFLVGLISTRFRILRWARTDRPDNLLVVIKFSKRTGSLLSHQYATQ